MDPRLDWQSRLDALQLLQSGTKGVKKWNQIRKEFKQLPSLKRAVLSGSYLRGVNLGLCDMSAAELRRADLQGANLRGSVLGAANLSNANLYKANLMEANLSKANLAEACASGTDFRNANLRNADLRGVDFTDANLSGADLYGANLSCASLRRVNLRNARLIEVNLTNAILDRVAVYGVSVWDSDLTGATQTDIVITLDQQSTISVDNLEVAQFLYLLLNNRRLRETLDTITKKVVLILGRFTPERKKLLERLKSELRVRSYVPVLFDAEKPLTRDFVETVSTLAHLCRFVVADFTDAKIVLEEVPHIVRNVAVPIVPTIMSGHDEPVTLYNLRRNHRSLLSTVLYRDEDHLVDLLDTNIVLVAEAAATEFESKG